MSFTLVDLLQSYDFLDLVYDFPERLDLEDARRAVDEVEQFSEGDEDLPAVIFFALARRSGEMGDAWWRLPAVLAHNYAMWAGFELQTVDDELQDLRGQIALREVTLDDVRAWFRERMKPLP